MQPEGGGNGHRIRGIVALVVLPETRHRLLWAACFALLALCGVLLAVVMSRPRELAPGGAAPDAETRHEPVPPRVEQPPPPPPESPPAQETTLLALPDGSRIAPLNGVRVPAAFEWGSSPYAPITGTVRQNGIDWWVHADGSSSTTLLLWRPELGRAEPVTLVAHPTAPVQVDTGPAAK